MLQAEYDLQVGTLLVPQAAVSSPVHRIEYPNLDPVIGDGAVPLLDTPTARLTADGSYWGTFPLQTSSLVQSQVDGVLVSVLGILVYDGSARSSATCPEPSNSDAFAAGIVAGISMYVNASDPVWEFTRPAANLDLGEAGRSVSTPDALFHITIERVVTSTPTTASAAVTLTVDLQGSLPEVGPVDQRLVTVTLASSQVSCAALVGAPSPSPSPSPSESDGAVALPDPGEPTDASTGAGPAVANADDSPTLAESGSAAPALPIVLVGAALVTVGAWMRRVRRAS